MSLISHPENLDGFNRICTLPNCQTITCDNIAMKHVPRRIRKQ